MATPPGSWERAYERGDCILVRRAVAGVKRPNRGFVTGGMAARIRGIPLSSAGDIGRARPAARRMNARARWSMTTNGAEARPHPVIGQRRLSEAGCPDHPRETP